MYQAIVKKIAKKNFERVNHKDYGALLAGCSPDIHHRFGGTHALGGERHDREALKHWFERLGRLSPGLTLTVHDVWVKGLPNGTTIVMRWSATDTRIDGSPYNNHGVHIKVVDIDAHEDSQVVAENLKLMAAHGVKEAAAPSIVS